MIPEPLSFRRQVEDLRRRIKDVERRRTFGFGRPIVIQDWNDAVAPGQYYGATSAANRPPEAHGFSGIVTARGDGVFIQQLLQMATDTGGDPTSAWIRSSDNSGATWAAWQKLATVQDTGWQPLSLMSGFTGSAKWRHVAPRTEIVFDISGSITTDATLTVSVPVEYRPADLIPAAVYANSASTGVWQAGVYISSAGALRGVSRGGGTIDRVRGKVDFFV